MGILKPIFFQVTYFFATISFRCEPGDCQQLLGPLNVTRYEHEANVYIPCSFSGSSNPIWRINGIDYEAFNLPPNMLPVSYGLLITSVELDMDGKSFQCILQIGQSQQLSSSIGILKVEKLSQEYNMTLYHERNAAIQTSFSSAYLQLNHQKIIFDSDFKTFSWIEDNSCNNYRVTAINCDGIAQNVLDQRIIQETSFAIPSSLVIDRNNHSLYFELESININDIDGTVCHRLPFGLAVKQSDITENQSISYGGDCVDVESEISPNVVLPSKTMGNDCTCSILIPINKTSYNLTTCSCAHDTIFMDSFFVFKQPRMANTYKMCFYNLTNEMNNTVIHFFASYRQCINSNDEIITRSFRMYLKSMKLVIELPYQPNITVDTTTGEVTFSSDTAEGIELDHYKVTLSDATNFIVYHRTIPRDMNSTSFGTIFQQHTCSPYNVTVKVYSVLGNSVTTTKIIGAENNQDECACIAEYVDVALTWIDIGEPGHPEIEIHVNCSQDHYEDTITFQIEVKHGGINITEPFTAVCEEKRGTQHIVNLDCDIAYDFIPYWISDTNKCCPLHTAILNMKVPCPSVTTESSKTIGTAAIAGFSVLGGSNLISIAVIIILCYLYYCRQRQSNTKSTSTSPPVN